MVNGISSSPAALSAYSTKLAVTANNVANFTTDGFKRTEATISQDSYGAPDVTLQKVEMAGPTVQYPEEGQRELSNVDLSMEMPQMMVARRAYEANLKVLESQNDMLKATLEILA
jgi:flagellar basal body rod protein FlgG